MIKQTSDYQSEKYVRRKEISDQVDQLFEQSESRLVSIIGPPGIGKSWLMYHLFESIKKDSSLLPLWLDLGNTSLSISIEGINWLREQTQVARNLYGKNFFHFNEAVSFEVVFREFVKTLCDFVPKLRPILFVDGFDEMIDIEASNAWQGIFANFWDGGCTRIIIARRDQQKLTHPILAWNDTPIQLLPFDEQQRREQIRKRAGEEVEITQQVEPYLSGNPFINAKLVERIRERGRVTHHDVQSVIESFFERANLTQIPQAIDLVKRLAIELPAEWTAIDLKQLHPSIKLENTEMEALFAAGIIQPIKGISRYTIDAGLTSLIKVMNNLERVDG